MTVNLVNIRTQRELRSYQSTVVRYTGPESSKFSLSDMVGSETLTIAVSDAIIRYYNLKYSPETCTICSKQDLVELHIDTKKIKRKTVL